MQKRQANRAVIAARIAPVQETRISVRETSEANRTARTADIREASKRAPRNRKAMRMTGAQRNSEGRKSEWNQSPYLNFALSVQANDYRWTRHETDTDAPVLPSAANYF